MGATGTSWRTTTTVIFIILQIPAVISVTTVVTSEEGQRFDFRCDYQDGQQNNSKYFCHVDNNVSTKPLIRAEDHNRWMREGRFSLYDNTAGAFFLVRVDKLTLEDSGTYLCGVDINPGPDSITVIQLNVSQGAKSPENLIHYTTPIPSKDLKVDKLHLPLYLTAVMCVAAILSVCLFTLCLLLAVKKRRSSPRRNRETSSDYETMMPGVRNEPELCNSISAPDCSDVSALPPDLCSHYTSKQRESTVSFGHGEYVDVDAPGHICQYQHLDLSQLEEHVYQSLHGNSKPKDILQGVKEQIAIDTTNG